MPLAILLMYGIGFAARGPGFGVLAFDDHPGQLARLTHMIREGPAPWAWNAGWWGGYAEMQFYPPGWFYLGAALSWISFGGIAPSMAYQILLWVTYLAPGVAAYVVLRRLLGDGWAALPGAFVVLTFSGDPAGGNASGVEGGVHIGMVAARLAWALLPCLAFALAAWTSRGGRFPRAAVVVLAAIVLTHPAHVPAALAILLGAAFVSPAPRAVMQALVAAAAAVVLAAFWLVPLLARIAETRALAWGSLGRSDIVTPLGAILVAAALLAMTRRQGGAWTAIIHALWLGILAVAVIHLIVEPLGVRFVPADRVADGVWMLLFLAAGLGLGAPAQLIGRRVPSFVAAAVVIAVLVTGSLPARALALWPNAADWPDHARLARGLRLEDLWRALRQAPPGRVLFIRSGVPLVYGTQWYRPHSHVTALTPFLAGRDIIGGTFTHGSPVAAFVYRGDAGPAPVTQLAERLDGRTLFGRPLDALDPAVFADHAGRLRVAAVVALEEDAANLGFLADSRYRRRVLPPFLLFVARDAPPSVRPVGGGRWAVDLDGTSAWRSTGMAYSPLWRAEHARQPVPTRRGLAGDLEVSVPEAARAVDLAYGPGLPEGLGLLASTLVLAALGVDGFRRHGVRR